MKKINIRNVGEKISTWQRIQRIGYVSKTRLPNGVSLPIFAHIFRNCVDFFNVVTSGQQNISDEVSAVEGQIELIT